MAKLSVFADEAGNFDFSNHRSASRYFILTTTTLDDTGIASDLLALRRNLARSGIELDREFHATTDAQAVRNQVFDVLDAHDFRVDATILEKRKALPRIRTTDAVFYRYAWFYHLKYFVREVVAPGDDLLVVAASVGTKSKRAAFFGSVRSAGGQLMPSARSHTAFWPAAVDPCLQVADYCSWAIQRKWERGDLRSHRLIQSKVRSEFDLFQTGSQVFY